MATNVEKFQGLLKELFQLDQADLDFGIYRIMNKRRGDIVRFLDNDLLPQIRSSFQQYRPTDTVALQSELDALATTIHNAGMNPEDSPKIQALRLRLDRPQLNNAALEDEVFSHLYAFFRRYYSEGDFLSLRRYKQGVYAIPYEGEEVKVHWANADQYYVKSSETFRDYTFLVAENRRVTMQIVAATTEHENRRPAQGNERRFVLSTPPFIVNNGDLHIRFEYRSLDEKEKQEALNKSAVASILAHADLNGWSALLSRLASTNNAPERTVLEKHLTQFTARNTFDYFVHKDLGGFLRRELDFYIKNEVMHLDDIQGDSVRRVEQYLSQIGVIRTIGHKIIAFLDQIETFQKRLWLKKKFVVETNYCITLDRVPDVLLKEIASNHAQLEEWNTLYALELWPDDDTIAAHTVSIDYLKLHPHLVVDTKFFNRLFRDTLIASFDDLDAHCNGIFFHADNFQTLMLIQKRFEETIKCFYIDPPYNTGSSAILYKNSYRHSSWCTLMRDRLAAAKGLLKRDGAILVSIDKTERARLEYALDEVFGAENHIEELIWTQATANSQLPNYSTNHEYVEVYARDRQSVESDKDMFREPKPGYAEIISLVSTLASGYPSRIVIQNAIRQLHEEHLASFREEVEGAGKEWNEETKRQDPWRGLYPYNKAEYRDKDGRLVADEDASTRDASIWIWREISPAAPASKQSSTTKDPQHFNFRFYKPLHPVSGKPCPHPRTGWKFPYQPDPSSPSRRSFVDLDNDSRIVWGTDEAKVPQTKGFLHEVETNIGTSVFYAYNDGEAELQRMFGKSGLFLSPKSSEFVRKFIAQTTKKDDWFGDFFGGSGSSGHALIDQNRLDGGNRKQILVEVGHHFDSLLIPRIKKAIYSKLWQNAKPTEGLGLSYMFKYLRLETYEDALNNLELTRSKTQSTFLDALPDVREQYVLSYMLDVESRGSQSLLNIDAFRTPDDYQFKIERNGEMQLATVDLAETFNWLLGLRVKHIDIIRGIRVVEGVSPSGDRVLVIWRNIDDIDNAALEKWFQKQDYNTREMTYDIFYVNGDNNLENLRRSDQTWKVRLIEEEFQRLMFDVQDA